MSPRMKHYRLDWPNTPTTKSASASTAKTYTRQKALAGKAFAFTANSNSTMVCSLPILRTCPQPDAACGLPCKLFVRVAILKDEQLTDHSWVYTGEQSGGESYSEIDILEQVNEANANAHSFYTGKACTVKVNKGNPTRGTDCGNHVFGEVDGCSFEGAQGTFGREFNDNKYRVVAMQLEADGIKIWHFKEGQVPSDIASGKPNPANWKNPSMDISPDNCDISDAFAKFKVVSNPQFVMQLLYTWK
jgi:hypothetical protein